MTIGIFEQQSRVAQLPRPALDYWWWPLGSPQRDKPTILVFGGAGSDHASMNTIHPLLKDANYGAWRMPGRGNRSGEPHPSDIKKLTQEVASTIVGLKLPRPILVGYSLGGLMAYTVCQELERLDFQVGRIVPVVSPDPRQWRLLGLYALTQGGFHTYTRKLQQKLEDAGGWAPYPIPDDDLLANSREKTLVDLRLALQHVRHTRVVTPITDITATDDRVNKFNHPQRWKRYTAGEFESILVTGGHYLVHSSPEKLAGILGNVANLAYNSY